MIVEVRDILDNKTTITHARLQRGMTVGQIFEADSRLRLVAQCVVQVTINGTPVSPWKDAPLGDGDRVLIDIAPKEAISIFLTTAAFGGIFGPGVTYGGLIAAALAGLSVIQFAIGLFNRPKPIKLDAPKDSPSYSFDGIKTSFAPGGPVPAIYGEHLTGGQVLGMAIDVAPSNNEQRLSLLIGLGVGPVSDVSCVRLNDIPIENFGDSVTWDWRSGTSSQTPIAGFEQIRNTFADGREVSSPSAITYASVGNQVDAVTLQIAALEGLGHFTGGTSPRLANNTTKYSIEYRPTGTLDWTIAESPRLFTRASRAQVWDAPTITFGSRSAWDIRLLWLGFQTQLNFQTGRGDQEMHRIWLRNVTEITDQTEPFCGTAVLAVKAVATNQLQGGAPNVTAMVRGRFCRAYIDEVSYVGTWTRNPAWCLLNYMTDSTFGMGAFTPIEVIDIPSFISFADLCDSLVSDGRGGMEQQHMLDLIMDKKKPHWAWVQEILGLYRSSMIYSQGKYKIITDRGDQPVRQIFHAGNIVPGTFKLTIGATDPVRPNQATVTFNNRNTDYNLDTIFVQDSASVLGAGDIVREFDLSLIGISRESEAVRNSHWQLDRRRQTLREAQFSTGLEALAVEPGDLAKVGVVTTGFELGYGGRLLEGDVFHLILDREIEVRSGYPYELYLWHIGADSMETRTLATTPGAGFNSLKTAVVSPTNPFNITPNANDRWAIGITSEDLMLGWVKRVGRDGEGRHELTVEQMIPINPVTPVLVSTPWFTRRLDDPPAQFISAVGTSAASVLMDGTVQHEISIDVVPAPLEEGGTTTDDTSIHGGGIFSVRIVGSHAPVGRALENDILLMTNSWEGYGGIITGHTLAVSYAQIVLANDGHLLMQTDFSNIKSGSNYRLLHRGGDFSGFDVFGEDEAENVNYLATVLGTQYTRFSSPNSFLETFHLYPFSTRGVRNKIGAWAMHITQPTLSQPDTPSGLAATVAHNGVLLSWNANADADLSHYSVYRSNSNAFGTAVTLGSRVTDLQFLESMTHVTSPLFYWIRAWNTSSAVSPIHPGSTNGVSPSWALPSTPSGLTGRINARGIFLNWAQNPEPGLSHYILNRNTTNAFGTSSVIAAVVPDDRYLDSQVEELSYYYWLRAVNVNSFVSPIHPGSTNGVLVISEPITQFEEATIATTTTLGVFPPSSLVSLEMSGLGGNLIVEGEATFSSLAGKSDIEVWLMQFVEPAWVEFDRRLFSIPVSGASQSINLGTMTVTTPSTINFFQIQARTFSTGSANVWNKTLRGYEVVTE